MQIQRLIELLICELGYPCEKQASCIADKGILLLLASIFKCERRVINGAFVYTRLLPEEDALLEITAGADDNDFIGLLRFGVYERQTLDFTDYERTIYFYSPKTMRDLRVLSEEMINNVFHLYKEEKRGTRSAAEVKP